MKILGNVLKNVFNKYAEMQVARIKASMGLSIAPPPPERRGAARKPKPYFVSPIRSKVAGIVSLATLICCLYYLQGLALPISPSLEFLEQTSECKSMQHMSFVPTTDIYVHLA